MEAVKIGRLDLIECLIAAGARLDVQVGYICRDVFSFHGFVITLLFFLLRSFVLSAAICCERPGLVRVGSTEDASSMLLMPISDRLSAVSAACAAGAAEPKAIMGYERYGDNVHVVTRILPIKS